MTQMLPVEVHIAARVSSYPLETGTVGFMSSRALVLLQAAICSLSFHSRGETGPSRRAHVHKGLLVSMCCRFRGTYLRRLQAGIPGAEFPGT